MISYFVLSFFSLGPIATASYLFVSCSEVRSPRVLYTVFMFINRQLFISRDIRSCDCISVFLGKSKIELCDTQYDFWEQALFF